MPVPIEAKTFTYVPESLREIEGAPKFVLRYGTRRDRNAYRAELAGRGLVSHGQAEIRDAMAEEIKRLSGNSDEAKDRMVETARRYWAASDSLEQQIKEWWEDCAAYARDNPEAELPPAPAIDFDPEEEAWITGIMQDVQANSAVIHNMRKANARRDFLATEVALAVVLVSAEGFDLRRDIDGLVDRECMAELQEWLGDRAEELGFDQTRADDPFGELRNIGFAAFHLPKDTEKNFASPPLPTSDATGSPAEAEDASSASPASAKSKATPSTATSTSATSSTSPSAAETETAGSTGPMAAAS
jgi:hypothetical protein